MTLEFREYLPPEPSPQRSPDGTRIMTPRNGARFHGPQDGTRTATPPNGMRIAGPGSPPRAPYYGLPPQPPQAPQPPRPVPQVPRPAQQTRRPIPQAPRPVPQAPQPVRQVPRRVPPVLPRVPLGPRLGGLHRPLREHRDVSGGSLRPAVFGAMDGLVTNASLIAGVGGGGANRHTIVLTGLAGLIAGAFSMATGEYISVTSQNELTKAEVELERLQHFRNPAEKREKLTHIFVGKGVHPRLAKEVVRQISADPDRAVAIHVREELGIDPDDLPSPWTAAFASFVSFTAGALIPLAPYLLGYPVLGVALVLAGVTAVVGGAAVAKLTERPLLTGGLRQFTAAFLATGMAFAIGHLIGAQVS
jgi:vacuolar iron transporter family protein